MLGHRERESVKVPGAPVGVVFGSMIILESFLENRSLRVGNSKMKIYSKDKIVRKLLRLWYASSPQDVHIRHPFNLVTNFVLRIFYIV